MDNNLIELKNDSLKLEVNPAKGGLITKFYSIKDDFDIIKEVKNDNLSGMFPLIPYSNRIRGGNFVYWGIKRNVPKNHPELNDPIHGDAWLKEWKIEEKGENYVIMSYEHDGKNGFPFSYSVRKKLTLKNSRLSIDISIKNTGSLPMPCGVGIHPYFKKDGKVLLKFKNKTIWADETSLNKQVPYKTDASYNFENGKELPNEDFDICFGGFDGHAEIIWLDKDFSLSIDAHEDFNHIVLFSPKDSDFFCLEPVTNATDAFNLASKGITGTGIQTIEPEEILESKIELRINIKK
ncbi:MAG: Aldose 1-epimerase [Alphaproteobacteria bacterium ADurb.Bin438]|nr:MAG: Aldose 1-epimerase [Alphaproteobacteria bacterium ADurb.Bin438]